MIFVFFSYNERKYFLSTISTIFQKFKVFLQKFVNFETFHSSFAISRRRWDPKKDGCSLFFNAFDVLDILDSCRFYSLHRKISTSTGFYCHTNKISEIFLKFLKSHSTSFACSFCTINVTSMEYLHVLESQFEDPTRLIS